MSLSYQVGGELPELIGMCDRIYIMCQGRITGCLNKNEFSQERIMMHATGLIDGAKKGEEK